MNELFGPQHQQQQHARTTITQTTPTHRTGLSITLNTIDHHSSGSGPPSAVSSPPMLSSVPPPLHPAAPSATRSPVTGPLTVKPRRKHAAAAAAAMRSDDEESGGEPTSLSSSSSSRSNSPTTALSSGPLSYSQERIFFMEQLFGPAGSMQASSGLPFTSFHISRLFRCVGELDLAALQQSLAYLINRHEQLRTRFSTDSNTGRPIQQVIPTEQATINISFTSLAAKIRHMQSDAGNNQNDGASMEQHESAAMLAWSSELDRQPFVLDRAPLMRCHVAALASPRRYAIFLMFHHLILDGWSMGTVLHELGVVYQFFHSNPAGTVPPSLLPALPDWNYLDFAEWHRDLCNPSNPHPTIARQLDYWKEYLRGYETLNLTLDFPRSANGPSGWGGDVVRTRIDAKLHQAIKQMCKQARVSLFSLLMSTMQLLLSKYTQQNDVVVGSSAGGRHYPQSRSIVGCFINPFACRTIFRDQDRTTFMQLLQQVHSRSLQSLANQDVPFDQVVAAVEAQETAKIMELAKSPEAATHPQPPTNSPNTATSGPMVSSSCATSPCASPTGSLTPIAAPFSSPSPTPSPTSSAAPLDLSKSPIFQVMLVLQNQNTRKAGLMDYGDDVQVQLQQHKIQTNKMDLTLVAEESRKGMESGGGDVSDDGIDLSFEYNTALFLPQSIERLCKLFCALLQQVVSNASLPLSEYTLLSDAERHQLVVEFNSNHRPEFLHTDTTLHALFDQQVSRTPNLPAVRLDDRKYSYTKLQQVANQAAHLIRIIYEQHHQQTQQLNAHMAASMNGMDVAAAAAYSSVPPVSLRPDDLIAICMSPCLEMFAFILGVLKSGCAYVPLDPNYPIERIQYMLEDSGAKMLITTQEMLNNLTKPTNQPQSNAAMAQATNSNIAASPSSSGSKLDIPIIIAEDDWAELREQPVHCPPSAAGPNNLAYVIYTSGSTGLPKGVMVEHANICNTARYIYPGMDAGTCILQFASQSFDAAVAEWSSAFVHGACLCLTRGKEEKIGQGFVDTIQKYGINIAVVSPSVLASIPPVPLPSVQYFVVAGEANTEAVLKAWRPFVPLENGYGPTETTVCASTFRYDDSHPACCIGRPQPNYTCYVLDENRKLLPIGVNGELYVGGAGITRGYLNRPELTKERFLPDPFAPANSPYKRMYKTGDVVRWLPDGTLLYVGRNDHQVKIRGVRIELGEIEHSLTQHPRVAQAVVLAKDMGARGKQLVTFIVPKKGATERRMSGPSSMGSPTPHQLQSPPPSATSNASLVKSVRKHVASSLPAHLRPTYFVVLPALPINNSAKTDLQALAKIPITDEHTGQNQTHASSAVSTHAYSSSFSLAVDRSRAGSGGNGGSGGSLSRTTRANSIINTRSPRTPFALPGGSPPFGKHGRPPAMSPSVPSTPGFSAVNTQLANWRSQLIAAWCKVLNRSEVGLSENFFEVGGHSLLAAQLHNTFSPELKQHLTLLHIFQHPTINSQLNFLKSKTGMTSSTPMLQGISQHTLSPVLARFGARSQPGSSTASPDSVASLQARRASPVPSMSGMAGGGQAGMGTIIGSPPGHPISAVDPSPSGPLGLNNVGDESMAIIGMAGRFPGANSVSALWSNLCQGMEGIKFYTAEELELAGVSPELLSQPNYVKAMGVMDDVFGFDAAFFHVNNREAESMDPQQRIFLETAWTALEDAGYCPNPAIDQEADTGVPQPRIAVFAGCGQNTYLSDYCALQFAHLSPAQRHSLMTVNEKDFLSSRISYKLNLRGPAVVVQTACSTSLVAVHMACEALKRGECDMALAGGVSLGMLRPTGYLYQEGMILSEDGHCKPFDEKASGTVRGQGSGAVVLKRLSAAIADGDLIYAVLKGSAINNDGSHKVSYSAPSAAGQVEVIRSALWAADVHPRTIGFVEAHGTGTSLGDPIEMSALTQAWREYTQEEQFALIGSIKSNVGHLDAAAGVVGLMKAALALQHNKIPPTLHFTKPNPQLDLEHTPFIINTACVPFPQQSQRGNKARLQLLSGMTTNSNGSTPQSDTGSESEADDDAYDGDGSEGDAVAESLPRRAAVSSFGIGGTNAHAILEQAPAETEDEGDSPDEPVDHPVHLLCWSATTEAACKQYVRNTLHYLAANPSISLKSVAYTLHLHRAQFSVRCFILARTLNDAMQQLDSISCTPNRLMSLASTMSALSMQGRVPSAIASPTRIHARRATLITNNPELGSASPLARTNSLISSTQTSIPSPVANHRSVADQSSSSSRGDHPRSLVFLFPGQGSQFIGMGMDLYKHEPVFRAIVQECVATLASIMPSQFANLTIEQLWQSDKINQTSHTQPALFIMEYALAQLLITWGLTPSAMLGHSLGQYVAACVAGIFSLSDCLKAILARSQLMQELVPSGVGAMLSVRMGESEFRLRYSEEDWPGITIAASNSPVHITVAGEKEKILRLKEQMGQDGQHCTMLPTSHAFHTPLLEPMVSTYATALSQLQLQEPTIPLICNVTGGWMDGAAVQTPDYWITHLRQKVCFTQGVETLLKAAAPQPTKPTRKFFPGSTSTGATTATSTDGTTAADVQVRLHEPIFIEIGPGDSCITLLKRHAAIAAAMPSVATTMNGTSSASGGSRVGVELNGVALQPKPKAGLVPDSFSDLAGFAHLMLKIGELWQMGVGVQWSQLYLRRHTRVRLPTYPFQHVTHVIKPESPLMAGLYGHGHAKHGASSKSMPSSPRISAAEKLDLADSSARSDTHDSSSFSHHTNHTGAAISARKLDASQTGNVGAPAAAPSPRSLVDKVSHQIVKLYGVLLGMDPSTLSAHSDFFSIGGDSLLAIQLLADLRKTCGIPLPGSILMSYPTPAALAARIAQIMESKSGADKKQPAKQQTQRTTAEEKQQNGHGPMIVASPPAASIPHGKEAACPSECKDPICRTAGCTTDASTVSSQSTNIAVTAVTVRTNGLSSSHERSQLQANSHPLPKAQQLTPSPVPFDLSANLSLDSALTLIQRGNIDGQSRLAPIYMVHPIGGELYYYRDMAPLLGLNRPVYGFRAVALDGDKEAYTDIRTMAADYVEELLQQRRGKAAIEAAGGKPLHHIPISESESIAVGPIIVGGVSFGGTVAYEMALLLCSLGYSVPLLVLIDAPAPGGLPTRLGDAAGVLEYIAGSHMGVTAEQLRELSSKQHTDVITAARNSATRLPSYITDSLINTWLAHEKAMFSYTPPTSDRISRFNGEVIFFRPSEALKHVHLNMHLPWIELVPQGVRICRVPGTHISMNARGMIHNWASILKKALDQIDEMP